MDPIEILFKFTKKNHKNFDKEQMENIFYALKLVHKKLVEEALWEPLKTP